MLYRSIEFFTKFDMKDKVYYLYIVFMLIKGVFGG